MVYRNIRKTIAILTAFTPHCMQIKTIIEEVIAEVVNNRQKCYIVQWADTYVLHRHVSIRGETGYKPANIARCRTLGKVAGPVAERLIAKIRWQHKEQPAGLDKCHAHSQAQYGNEEGHTQGY